MIACVLGTSLSINSPLSITFVFLTGFNMLEIMILKKRVELVIDVPFDYAPLYNKTLIVLWASISLWLVKFQRMYISNYSCLLRVFVDECMLYGFIWTFLVLVEKAGEFETWTRKKRILAGIHCTEFDRISGQILAGYMVRLAGEIEKKLS